MDARELLDLVQQAVDEEMDYYRLSALIAGAQKESDAKLAELMGASSVAAAIRATN